MNFTVKGDFCTGLNCYLKNTPEEARAFVENRGVEFYTPGVWNSMWTAPLDESAPRVLEHGTGMMIPPHLELYEAVRYMLDKARNHSPELKRLLYVRHQITTEPGAPEKYTDSLVTDASGAQSYYGGARYPIFFPTLTNSYRKRMFEVIDWILCSFDVEGLYCDEFAYSATPMTYSTWDGHSVEIDDETHLVKRKIGTGTLVLELGAGDKRGAAVWEPGTAAHKTTLDAAGRRAVVNVDRRTRVDLRRRPPP